MNIVEIKLEDFIDDEKAKVVRIHKNAGDKVKCGEAIFDVEGEKAATTVKSETDGEIKEINVTAGDTVSASRTLAVIVPVETSGSADTVHDDEPSQTGTFDYFEGILQSGTSRKEIECDITIIGAGPGGYVAAIHAAQLGASVTLVEKETVGGTCLNWGCIPTKALARSAEVFRTLKEAKRYGCDAGNISVDIHAVMNRKDRIVKQLVKGIHSLLGRNGVELLTGKGVIKDDGTVAVNGDGTEAVIKSKNIIIATGSQPARLPIPGAGSKNVINSKQALQLDELPRSMVIVGGGVIGMEFGFIFNAFGVNISVVEYLDQILPGYDTDISKEITRVAYRRGIKVYTGAEVERISDTGDGKAIVAFRKNDDIRYITGDKVLMAVGRVPYPGDVGIEALGIELNDNGRGIKVNSKMETNVRGIYAIGDVTGGILLAHVASHEGVVAVNNIAGKPCDMDYSAVPSAIFTEPEIATVGLDETTAREQGMSIEVGKFPFAASGKALTEGKTVGHVKLMKEKETGRIVGASMIGPHVTDLIAEVTLAVRNGLKAEQIIETIHAHPTTAEAIHEAALAAGGKALHFAG